MNHRRVLRNLSLFIVLWFFTISNLALADNKELIELINAVCLSPAQAGKYLDFHASGGIDAGGIVKLTGANINGEVILNKSEYEGMQQVLKERLPDEHESFRRCSMTLTPLFLEKFSIEKQSSTENKISKDTDAQVDSNIKQTEGEWTTIGRYQVKGGLVKDTKNGLMWMRCSVGEKWVNNACQHEADYTEKQFEQLAATTNNTFDYEGHYTDWRMPTIDELRTLMYCRHAAVKFYLNESRTGEKNNCGNGDYDKPTISVEAFPDFNREFLSSSRDSDSNPLSAHFKLGEISYFYIDDSKFSSIVHLVRNAK